MMREDMLALTRIADFSVFVCAMFAGLPLGCCRWMRLLSTLAFSNASFLALR